MQNRTSYYYRYERVYHNDSVHKYILVANVNKYPGFNAGIETKAFRAILYQPERICVYRSNKQGEDGLTVLVNWKKEERIGVLNLKDASMITISSPDYQRVELFVVERRMMSYMKLLELIEKGDCNSMIKNLRKKAGFDS